MNLGFMVSIGNSVGDARRAGQLRRLLTVLDHYAGQFERVYYFSYADERLQEFTQEPRLLRKVTIAPRKGSVPLRAYSLLLPWYWRRQLRDCHVILVGQAVGALPAVIARLAFGIPFVVTFGYRYSEFARLAGRRRHALLLKRVEQVAARLAARVIVRTPELAAEIGRMVPEEKIRLIPNGVDTRLFAPASRPPANDPPVALFVGRLEPQKNLEALIDAVALLRPEFPLRLVLVGEGSLRETLAERAAAHALEVTFAGTLPHEALPARLREADLFVLPSFIEGHPKALLEAMSAALPCVGTDVPGIRDLLVDGETGILCSGTGAASLAAGMWRALSDREGARALGRAARALVERRYDLSALLRQEVELLKREAVERK